MGYLEQFARNRRRKEKSEVLTARLPESLYSEFKTHCDELGLSISEAVCLLVEHEINTNKIESTTNNYTNDELATTKECMDVVEANTQVNTIENQKRSNTNTKRFTVKQYEVNGELPCPLCKQWINYSNFSRHAKQHETTTQDIFTNEEHLQQVNEMIKERNEGSE